uniref:Chromo domain-containing protein n=1 Tax=Caenorhabditis japonica TaxID=281687 RepID=A0A8R1HX08_CAEJA
MVQKTEKPACKTTPKGRKRVSKKAVQKKDQSDDVTSTTFYVVEKIKESKLIDQTIHYNIKWEDWPEIANTDEPETRLMCDKKLLEFALSRVTSKLYVTRIRDELNALESEFQSDYLETLDPLAICAQTTIFAGSVKFVNWDTIGSKIMLLKYLRDYQQSYVLNSMYFPEFEDIDKGFDEYSKQLRYRMEQFPEYPMVQIKLPVEKQPTFYAPPPLTNLLFEPVTEQIYDSRSNHFFPPKSTKLGFNQVQPFIAPKYFEYASVEDHPRYQESRAKAMGGDTRWNFDHLYRFDLSFVLRQEVGRGWTLRVAHSVKANTPLMMMTGVVGIQS